MNEMEIGKRIKSIREKRKMTLGEFGGFIYYTSMSEVSKWERAVKMPSEKKMKKIAEIGNITLEELVNGTIDGKRMEKALMLLELYEKSDHVEFRNLNRNGNNTRAFAESFIEPYKEEGSYLFEFENDFGFLEVNNENYKISIGCHFVPTNTKKATNG